MKPLTQDQQQSWPFLTVSFLASVNVFTVFYRYKLNESKTILFLFNVKKAQLARRRHGMSTGVTKENKRQTKTRLKMMSMISPVELGHADQIFYR